MTEKLDEHGMLTRAAAVLKMMSESVKKTDKAVDELYRKSVSLPAAAILEQKRARRRAAIRNDKEDLEQMKFIVWARPRSALCWHTPNARDPRQRGSYWQAMGVMSGIPDVLLILNNGVHIAIEFKSATGSTSDRQDAVLEIFGKLGWKTAVARSCEWAQAFVKKFM